VPYLVISLSYPKNYLVAQIAIMGMHKDYPYQKWIRD